MKITEVNLLGNKINNGLHDINMKKLDKVVLLAGKNGAGKTRLLNSILTSLNEKPKKTQVERAVQAIKNIEQAMNQQNIQIKEIKSKLKIEPDNINLSNNLKHLEGNILSYQSQIDQNMLILNWDSIITDELYENYIMIPFIPKELNLKDSSNLSKNSIKSQASTVSKNGVKNLAGGTFAMIQYIQDRYYNATYQNASFEPDEIQEAVEEYDRLKKFINMFLGVELGRNIDGEPTLFGLSLGKSNLSDGQKILLQLCIAIFSQTNTLNDVILVLDEPENHLHPSIIIESINKILEINIDGQIWISTHSIAILSSFDPKYIWYMDEGHIGHAGKIPEKVLSSLLGKKEQIYKLQDFISLPGVFAINRHAFESLFQPLSILTGKEDPQTMQIREELKNIIKKQQPIRIVDFGGGQGRLFRSIIDHLDENYVRENIDYYIIDTDENCLHECQEILSAFYVDGKIRFFNDVKAFFTHYDKESVDVVVMCNVLHEIDPINWLSLFSSDGDISELLKFEGALMIVEDHEMPIGEKAYQNGFLVLDSAELKDLFCIKEDDVDFHVIKNDSGRLKTHLIKKEYMNRITPESRIIAIKSLNKNAAVEIKKIRADDITYRNGKKHGFWIQQLANSSLWSL